MQSDASKPTGELESNEEMMAHYMDDAPAIVPQDAPFAANAFAVSSLIDEGPIQPTRSKALRVAGFNAAVISSSLTLFFCASAAAAFLRAGPAKSTPIYLLSALPGLWDGYQWLVGAFPVVTKAMLTGVTYVVGDMLAQVVQIRRTAAITVGRSRAPRHSSSLLLMDPWRYLRSGLAGLVLLGPFAHFYYEGVAHFLDHWPVPLKILLDQTIYLASYNTVYYLVLGLLAGRHLRQVVSVYRIQFFKLIRAGWKIWPAIGIITYNFIPTEHRVLFVDAVEVAYCAVLSTLSNESPDH